MNLASPSLEDKPMKESRLGDEIIALASIAVPPTNPLEQYLLEHENDMHMEERDEIDKIVLEQYSAC